MVPIPPRPHCEVDPVRNAIEIRYILQQTERPETLLDKILSHGEDTGVDLMGLN
jgi:hypothetical protein